MSVPLFYWDTLSFYVDAGGPNSGHHAWTTSTLLRHPSSSQISFSPGSGRQALKVHIKLAVRLVLMIPVLRRLRQEDGHKFKVSVGYIVKRWAV